MARRAAPHRGIDVHYGDAEPEAKVDADADEGYVGYAADNRPSKTQRKQQSHDLQALGKALAELSAERFAAIEMPEILRDAITEFRRTRSFEGKRRQMQYVGKLMRGADEAMLREAVASATVGSAKETLLLHETERWRAELIADDETLTTWLHEHPDTDTQQLRSLVRAARRDAKDLVPEARQPKSHRELFQFIKPVLAAQAGQPIAPEPEDDDE
jgi:ribosome-associated protein